MDEVPTLDLRPWSQDEVIGTGHTVHHGKPKRALVGAHPVHYEVAGPHHLVMVEGVSPSFGVISDLRTRYNASIERYGK